MNREAQRDLYNQYSPKMYPICLRYMKNKQDAEDCLQDGFIKVFKCIHQFQNKGSFEGWLRTVFATTCLGELRKRRIFFELEDNILDRRTALDSLYEKDVLNVVDSLPCGFKNVFTLYNEGYSHKEVGEILNISNHTSKSQYCRARGVLRRKIA